ncbi:hypothetical protein CHLNCDRAFT_137160 [Chlorella variabilis]|uniref:Potassium channel tetramerisation-type BTB domain-containing protein n=1 Tax=Chlorella variabilis TaxID=554065 RepID=E1ZLD5_CHLVA|nr:hypothetical protein CHLNCDRAFT_137160 [Chlorella variabilis]EFN53249.1 hypothetical protein CHLNCDRAFT_137160 [Chlorella variabilis]|eukprot:XP_005845351.1 hypothetical protein CHLNCDRAFT_137160 [Chlorella variabilis]
MRDAEGNVFIDRDPRWFQTVLNFLRDSWVPLPPTIHERQQLYQEAQFYMLELLPS